MPFWPFKRAAPLPAPRETSSLVITLPGPDLNPRPIGTRKDQLSANLSWVYACTSLIAADVRANPWKLYRPARDRKDWRVVDEANAAYRVLKRPSREHTWGSLIELTDLHLSLCGEAFWNLITTTDGGRVVGLQIIYPHWVEGRADNEDKPGWKVTVPGRAPQVLPDEDVIVFRNPHPTDPRRGASPVEAFAVSYDMDLYARAYGAALLRNRAQPDGLLSSEQELTPEQADAIRERWKDNHSQPGYIAVLGKGAKYQALSVPLKDLAFLELARLTRDNILAIYKVPASKLGLLEDANRANGDEADENYKESAVLPRLRKYGEAINTLILPRLEGGKGLVLEFENPVGEDETYHLERAKAALNAGAIKVNEFRTLIGLDPASDGDVYLIPNTVRAVRTLTEAAQQAAEGANANQPEPAPPV